MSVMDADWTAKRLLVRLTRGQLRRGPDVNVRQPVSRAHEAALLSHYSYPYLLGGSSALGPRARPSYRS
jgi:hypothetical protein